jgi:hypothetical protein
MMIKENAANRDIRGIFLLSKPRLVSREALIKKGVAMV